VSIVDRQEDLDGTIVVHRDHVVWSVAVHVSHVDLREVAPTDGYSGMKGFSDLPLPRLNDGGAFLEVRAATVGTPLDRSLGFSGEFGEVARDIVSHLAGAIVGAAQYGVIWMFAKGGRLLFLALVPLVSTLVHRLRPTPTKNHLLEVLEVAQL